MGRVINLLNSPIIGKKSSFSFVSLLTGLGIRKKNENSFKTPIKNIEESDSKRNQSHLLFQEDSFPELPACAYKPALLPKPSKEKIKEAVDKMCNNRKAHNSASVENGVIPIFVIGKTNGTRYKFA